MNDGRIRIAIAALTMALLAGCGGSESDDEEAGSAPPTSTTVTVATTAAVAYRNEVGVPTPPDALAVSMINWTFTPSTLRATTESLNVALRNDEPPCSSTTCSQHDVEHNFSILDPATRQSIAQSETLHPGDSGLLVVKGLPAGTYEFVCSRYRHATTYAMKGTLEVTAI